MNGPKRAEANSRPPMKARRRYDTHHDSARRAAYSLTSARVKQVAPPSALSDNSSPR